MKIEQKIEQLPSGSYRVRKQVNNQKISLLFDHIPTEAEVVRLLLEKYDIKPNEVVEQGSFEVCATSYIESKNNVISPKTAREYYSLLNNTIPGAFKAKKIDCITQQDIQIIINDYASNHAPKTVHNLHGFISGVFKQFRPSMVLTTTLPQRQKKDPYTPSEEEIKKILDASKDDIPNHVCFQLGCMGLRRSEILALTLEDFDYKRRTVTIDKAMVQNKDKEWVIKSTKTTESERKLFVPECLFKEIRSLGYVYNRHPNKMAKALTRYQDKLGIPHFRFHDLRHFFASYAHSQGISDADIMATGGWSSDYTMKRIYRHEMNARKSQETIFNAILS